MKMKQNDLDVFLLECQNKRLSKHTLKAYRIDLYQAYQFFNQKEIDKKVLLLYLTDLNSKYKTKTVKRKMAVLHAFFEQQRFDGKIKSNPLDSIRYKLKEEKRIPRVIKTEDLRSMIQTLYAKQMTDYYYLRDCAVIELLISTGIRVTELCQLKREDINFEERCICVYGKGAKERIIYLGEKALNALSAYYCHFEDDIKRNSYFFLNNHRKPISDQSVRRIVSQHSDHLDTHLTPHMFRHTFATLLLEQDVDVAYIQKILGHSSIQTTMIYALVSSHKQKEILLNKNPRAMIDA